MKFETSVDDFHKECEAIARIKRRNYMMGTYTKSGNCPLCDFPLDNDGDCTNFDCPSYEDSNIDFNNPFSSNSNKEEEEEEEKFCDYCGEPLENGLCSASCRESAADEGREEEPTVD